MKHIRLLSNPSKKNKIQNNSILVTIILEVKLQNSKNFKNNHNIKYRYENIKIRDIPNNICAYVVKTVPMPKSTNRSAKKSVI